MLFRWRTQFSFSLSCFTKFVNTEIQRSFAARPRRLVAVAMPSLGTAAWDNLLLPSVDDSTAISAAPASPAVSLSERRMTVAERGRSKSSLPYFSPTLYAINELALPPHSPPVPDEDFSSPYLLNHKRRDALPRSSSAEEKSSSAAAAEAVMVERKVKGKTNNRDIVLQGDVDAESFDPPEAREDDVAILEETAEESSSRGGGHSTWMQSPSTNHTEFYDADDGFPDSPQLSSTPMNLSNELHDLRNNLLEEIVRRKKAEEALCQLQNQWKSMCQCLSEVGITLPDVHQDGNTQNDLDLSSFCQEITVARFVSEAIGRALARAEIETAANTAIDSKNHEIQRLKDRIQYYEAVNHEMSQRNQEAIECARQQRLKSRSRRKWIWGCITLSSIIGASIVAYSYLNESHMIQLSNQPADDSSTLGD